MSEAPVIPDRPLFRKVPVQHLRPGMFVCDLQADWLTHSFWRPCFLIKDERMLARLLGDPIREVIIDTRKGLDVAPPVARPNPDNRQRFAAMEARFREAALRRRNQWSEVATLEEERRRMQFFRRDAGDAVLRLREAIRAGGKADLAATEPVIERIVRSVQRHPDALIPSLQSKGDYGIDHALGVAAMTVALGSTVGLGDDTLFRAAQGALLQDVGTVRIPPHILNKPGRLSDEEMRLVRRHVLESQLIVQDSPGVTETMLDIVVHHHERIDGTGYPHALPGERIPLHAQVAAIADAYDALTSERPHQARMEPGDALRLMYSQAGSHFRADLLGAFVRTVGVYPVGSLVRLDNGLLAVVTEVHRDKLLLPQVRVMFDTRSGSYVRPRLIDLGRRFEAPAIVGTESYARWGIDPRRRQVD